MDGEKKDTGWIDAGYIESSTSGYVSVMRRLAAVYAATVRGLLALANDMHIQKEDIVTVLKEEGQFIMIYSTDE